MTNPATPDWAYEVAAERSNKDNAKPLTLEEWKRQVAFHELAATIAKHEERPVDPDLEEARKMAACAAERFGDRDSASLYRAGRNDDLWTVEYRLEGIKRGRELEREGK